MIRYCNYFERLNPITLIIHFIGVIFLSFSADTLPLLTVSVLSGLLLCLLLGSGKTAVYALPLMIFVIILNPLFSHSGDNILFYLNDNPITLEAVLYGVRTALLILSVLLWFSAANRSVSEDKFLYIFSKPFPTIALMVSMIFKTASEFRRRYAEMKSACETLGFSVRHGKLASRVKNGALFLNAVIGTGLENSVDTAVSMMARGYMLKHKTGLKNYRYGASDAVVSGVSILLFAASVTLISLNITVCGAAAYAVFLNIPVIYNTVEEVRWMRMK